MEIRDPNKLAGALGSVTSGFSPMRGSRRAVEGREFSLSFASYAGGRLRADRIRLENAEAWELRDGSMEQPGSEPLRFRQATLLIAGSKAGELTCETTNGIVHLHLLSQLSKKNPNQ